MVIEYIFEVCWSNIKHTSDKNYKIIVGRICFINIIIINKIL